MTSTASGFDECLDSFDLERHRFRLFSDSVASFFVTEPSLSGVVHSVMTRLKGRDNLRGKLERKRSEGVIITKSTLFTEITDLAGVRIFHLHNAQFPLIHREIMRQVDRGDWVLGEAPKVFSWDPEATAFYSELGFAPEIRPTFYTSIHYLLKPNATSDLCCEVQVRTLFEEAWGEIDHLLNYPVPTPSIACREQLRALSKLVGTGSRLVDSIVRSSSEYSGLTRSNAGSESKSVSVVSDTKDAVQTDLVDQVAAALRSLDSEAPPHPPEQHSRPPVAKSALRPETMPRVRPTAKAKTTPPTKASAKQKATPEQKKTRKSKKTPKPQKGAKKGAKGDGVE